MMFECIDKIYPSVSIDTVTGSICNFTDNIGGLPLKSCVSQITGYQEGSGTPSPDNVRAIHGWNKCNLSKCGVNFWDEQWELGNYDVITGEKSVNNNNIRCKNPIPCKPNTEFYFKCSNNSGILFYEKDGTYINYVTGNNRVITTPPNAWFICFYETSGYGTTYRNDISLNYPSTDTQYHPYTGNTYTIAFGQTIYQGSIDWKSGVVVATWGYIASYNGETLTGEWLCNKAPYEVGTTPPTGSQVAYELATPIEIPLGGINLLTQEGQNNIYADCGDTTVEYIKIV